MALRLEDKKAIVAEVNAAAGDALSAVLADYRGLSVEEMTELRAKAREANVYMRVVRNTLAKRAVAGTEFECLTEALTGPTLIALSTEDPGSAARIVKDFAKDHAKLEVRALSIGGELLPGDQIDRVAKLPTRDEALALLMAVMQAPITKLARTLNDIPGQVTRVVAAVRDQKQDAA